MPPRRGPFHPRRRQRRRDSREIELDGAKRERTIPSRLHCFFELCRDRLPGQTGHPTWAPPRNASSCWLMKDALEVTENRLRNCHYVATPPFFPEKIESSIRGLVSVWSRHKRVYLDSSRIALPFAFEDRRK